MQCNICHRPLTDPDSIRRGVGPICWARVTADAVNESNRDQLRDIPLNPETLDIVCRRDPEHPFRLHFNISQVLVLHSPTGMEWGYGGSGPADFALNILNLFAGPEFAHRWHKDFKARFVAGLPREGGTIPGALIRDYIRAQQVAQAGMDELWAE